MNYNIMVIHNVPHKNYPKGLHFVYLHYFSYIKYFGERKKIVKHYLKLKENKALCSDKYYKAMVQLNDELFCIENRNKNISQVAIKLGNGLII